jgi:inorganic triphosphatase YgiF
LEIELKAGLDDQAAARFARRLNQRAGASEARMLKAVYYDTPDRALRSAGIALRVRREGRDWVQAAKWGRQGQGGFQQLNEVECRLRGPAPDIAALPDPTLREAIGAALAGARLEPWFATRVRRRIWHVQHAIGLVEVALDRGAIEAGGASEPVLEAEFELKGGSPEAVFALAAELVGDMPADLLLPSKAQRGMRLAEAANAKGKGSGKGKGKSGARRKPTPSAAGQDGGKSWSALLAVLSTVVAAELHRLFTADDPEGPHQLRVALRRLRAAERMHRPILDPDVADEIAQAARSFGRCVAPLRDSDVMIETFCSDGQAPPALVLALVDAGARVRDQVRHDLRAAGATAFAIRLLQLSNIGGWRPAGRARSISLGTLAADSLDARWRRVSRLGDKLATLTDEDRHTFRKEIKKLRYLLEIQSAPDENSFRSHLKKLQESLGTLNDLAVLNAWSPDALPDAVRPAFEDVRGALLQSTQARADLALGRACRHWRTLRALPHPWEQPSAP